MKTFLFFEISILNGRDNRFLLSIGVFTFYLEGKIRPNGHLAPVLASLEASET